MSIRDQSVSKLKKGFHDNLRLLLERPFAESPLLKDPNRVQVFLEQQKELFLRMNTENPYSNEYVSWNGDVTSLLHKGVHDMDAKEMMQRQRQALRLDDWKVQLMPALPSSGPGDIGYTAVFPYQADLNRVWKCAGNYAELGAIFLRHFEPVKNRYYKVEGEVRPVSLDPEKVSWDPFMGTMWMDIERATPADPDTIRFHQVKLIRAYRCHSARNARRKAQLLAGRLALDYIQLGCALIGLPELLERSDQPWLNAIGNVGYDPIMRTAVNPLYSLGKDGVHLLLRPDDYICILSDSAVV